MLNRLMSPQERIEALNLKEGPLTTVIGIPVCNRKTVMMRRTGNVAAQRNCWSLPSGGLDLGHLIEQQFQKELVEELNVEVIPKTFKILTVYENFSERRQFTMVLVTQQVRDWGTMENREPEKHSEIKLVTGPNFLNMVNPSLFKEHQIPIQLDSALQSACHHVLNQLGNLFL